MALEKEHDNGRLEEAMRDMFKAMTALQLAQAMAVQTHAAFEADMSQLRRQSDERFGRIEAVLADHSRILADHTRILGDLVHMMSALPEAVREKMGFRVPEKA